MRAYRRIEIQQALAASTDPIYSKPCESKHGIKVYSAYLIDKTTNIGTSVEFGIDTGSIRVPLKVAGATVANVPVAVLDPFIMNYGDRLYAIMTTVTLSDTIVFVIFGEYLDQGIEEAIRGH
jgi:hypothetical protein